MIANLASFIIMAFFFWGRSLRFKNLRLHIAVMLSCFAADLILVLALVFMREALSQVSLGMHWTLMIHIPVAVTTIALYMFTVHAGYRLYRGHENARPWLRDLDKILCVFRVLTFVTALTVTLFRVKV